MSSPIGIDVCCTGSPFEMGKMQGQTLGDRIRTAVSVPKELEAFRLQQPWWLPYFIYRRMAEQKSKRFLQAALANQHPEAAARLRGIADAAHIPLERLYLLNALEAVMADLTGRVEVPVLATGACSAVAITRSASQSGTAVVAQNFDYLPIIQPFYIIRECRPAGGHRSLEFTAAPLSGAINGINEAGLAVTYNYAYTTRPATPAPTISMRLSCLLAECRTASEAIEYLRGTSRWGSGLLMLADADREIASVEITSESLAVRKPGDDDRDWLSHSNRFHCPTTQAAEVPANAVHSERAPAPLRNVRVHRSAEIRDARFRDRLQADSPFGLDTLATLMADHGGEGEAGMNSICMHSDYWTTTACLQLLPAERGMRVAFDSACQATYSELTL